MSLNDGKQNNIAPTVLVFHKLTPDFSYGSTNYTPLKFEKLLNHLTDSGFSFISISELEKAGEKDILITFDDGYQHLNDFLPEFINKYQIKPLIFIPTAFIGQENSWDYSYYFKKEYHLSIAQMKELSESHVSFGSHGHNHTDLTRLTQVQLAEELSKSKKLLEDILENEIDTVSYPFGRYDSQVKEYTELSEYKYAFTMSFPNQNDTSLNMGRIPVYGIDSIQNIMRRIKGKKLYKYEMIKCTLINKLSKGTILLNKLRRS